MSTRQTEPALSTHNPPAWANSLVKWALRTPVIQSALGQDLALLSFAGRRTGNRYSIPISYHREGDAVTLVTRRARTWWHNFENPIDVEIRLAGEDRTGTARIATDDDAGLEFMVEYLRKRPADAKAFGLSKVEATEERVAGLLPHLAIIQITLAP